jgi:hypothetical protein
VFVYLIARGHKMGEHAAQAAADQEAQLRQYVQSVATTSGGSGADELAKLADLRDRGALTAEEFEARKRMLLGG